MTVLQRAARTTAVALALIATSACANSGLGNVLGSVLGGAGGGNELAGTIQGVDTRNQQIGIIQSNGQTVGVRYDNNTRVIYQNQNYPVTALENGDQVVARIQDNGNGNYYTDSIQVTQSAQNGGTGTGSGSVQSFQGTVRQVDIQNGLFTIDGGTGYVVTVSMPYNPTRADLNRFQNLRQGDQVRFYGVALNNTRIELRQFY
jgi:exosome complex RNA-binding protein Csl4